MLLGMNTRDTVRVLPELWVSEGKHVQSFPTITMSLFAQAHPFRTHCGRPVTIPHSPTHCCGMRSQDEFRNSGIQEALRGGMAVRLSFHSGSSYSFDVTSSFERDSTCERQVGMSG